jgi:hypothetical protein
MGSSSLGVRQILFSYAKQTEDCALANLEPPRVLHGFGRSWQKVVRTAGLEPAQGFPQGILSPLRLPFRHVRRRVDNCTTSATAMIGAA